MLRTAAAALALCIVPAAAAGSSPTATGAHEPGAAPEAQVVGGRQAVLGRWDDAVGVYFEGTSWPSCTGTLIAPTVVLTAGHCIGGVSSVQLGVNDFTMAGGETIDVVQEIEYPDSQSTYDVGILILAQPSAYEPRVIATGCAVEQFLTAGAPVAIVGWGSTATDGGGENLLLMEGLSTISSLECDDGLCNPVGPGGELIAGGAGVDSCYGDSGGPLYRLTEDQGDFLVGVTSRGLASATTDCGEGGIYVRPDAVIGWIEENAGVSLPRATCHSKPSVDGEEDASGVTIIRMEVEMGDTVHRSLDIDDPEGETSFTLEATTSPAHGQVAVDDDGTVSYTAMADYEGPDLFVVRVTDMGVPPLSTTVRFEIAVVESTGGCGCRAGGGHPISALILLLGLVPLLRRRG